MGDILSQDEVDALLRGVSDGDVDLEGGAERDEAAREYDLTSQERIIRGRMPAMEMANERFARLFRLSISGMLRRVVDVSGVSVEMTKFVDFVRGIPLPSSINLFSLDPLRGNALLVFGATFVFTLIEYYFGGNGKGHMKPEGREFTSVEQHVIQKVVTMALHDLQEAWTPIMPVRTAFVRSEMNPQFVTIVAPTELVVRVELQVEVESNIDRVFLCIPYSMLEPIKDRLHSGYQSDKMEADTRWVSRMRDALQKSNVDVHVLLGKAHVLLREMKELRIGDVIVLDTNRDDPLPVTVEGIPKYTAKPGIFKGSQAIQIQSFVSMMEGSDGSRERD